MNAQLQRELIDQLHWAAEAINNIDDLSTHRDKDAFLKIHELAAKIKSQLDMAVDSVNHTAASDVEDPEWFRWRTEGEAH